MPPGGKRTAGPTPVEALTHDDKRVNIPTATRAISRRCRVDARPVVVPPRHVAGPAVGVWRGKDTQDAADLAVDAPPIYIQEKIDPRVLIEDLRRTATRPEEEPELTLFEGFDGLDSWDAIDFYRHEANWSNRMILGGSLQVMDSVPETHYLPQVGAVGRM
jgi:adenine-specific DNA-methyltransferase